VTRSGHIQRKSRPWIATVVAYAVALQMLLSAAVASQAAATTPAGAFPICFGAVPANGDGTGQGDSSPIHQAPCILCSIGFSAPVDLAAASVVLVVFDESVVVLTFQAGPRLAQAPPSPRLSQGPPQIV
jgi:hypothetical protein